MSELTQRALELVRRGAAFDEEELLDAALFMVHEASVYGVDALDPHLLSAASGTAIAAMVCEDIEGALALEPLLQPKTVEVEVAGEEPAADSGEEDATPEPRVETRLVRPRVVEDARGLGVPAILLATRHPDQVFEIVATNEDRHWWMRRLAALFGLRNLRVVDRLPQDASVDLLLLKGFSDAEAATAARCLRPGGTMALWQRRDGADALRRRGSSLRLTETVRIGSEAARGRVVQLLEGTTAELDAVAATS